MREFSLVYGRFRQVPLIVALVVMAASYVYVAGRSDAVDAACVDGPPPTSVSAVGPAAEPCAGELPGPAGCDADGLCVPEGFARIATAGSTSTIDPAWAKARPGPAVPFVSLQPSPDGMTDAGRRMVADAAEDRQGG